MTGQTIDFVIIIVYVLSVAGIGIAMRGKQQGIDDYFLGGRGIAWPLILLSIVATETSTVSFLSIPGKGYSGDLTFLQLPLGYIIGRIGVAYFLLPLFFQGQTISLYQIIERQFGIPSQRLTSFLFIVTRTLADGLRLYLMAMLLEIMTGWNFYGSVAAVGVATILYTFFGGIRSVIWTDFLQFFVYIIGAFIALWLLISSLPNDASAFWSHAASTGKLRVFDFAEPFSNAQSFWAGLIGGAVLSAATHGADQLMVQRYLATNSLKHARLALVSSGFIVLLQFALFLVIGVALAAFYTDTLPPDMKPDRVFSQFIVDHIPTGIRGIIIAAAFSAGMSTLSSSLNSISSAVVADFCPKRTSSGLFLARLFTILAGIGQIAVAMSGPHLGKTVVDSVLAIASFTTGITLGVLLLGKIVKQSNSFVAVPAMIAGAAAVTSIWIALPNTVSWPWYALIGSSITVGTGFILNLIIAPQTPSSTAS